jgi:hypothetical protein
LTERVSVDATVVGVADGAQMVQAAQLVAAGVTADDGADAGPAPTALLADTVNVYAVPLVSPETVTLVAGGLPETVVTGCAAAPMNGVTV